MLGGDGYMYYLYCGDGFMGVHTCQNSNVHFKCVWFILCLSYRSKTGKVLCFKSLLLFSPLSTVTSIQTVVYI